MLMYKVILPAGSITLLAGASIFFSRTVAIKSEARKMKMLAATVAFLPLTLLPALLWGQPDSALSLREETPPVADAPAQKAARVAIGGGLAMDGAYLTINAEAEALFAQNRWGALARVSQRDFSAGITFHLKPRLSSSFVSLQYQHKSIGVASQSVGMVMPMFTYRAKKYFQAGAGIGSIVYKDALSDFRLGALTAMLYLGAYITNEQLTEIARRRAPRATRPKAVYAELGGQSILYAICYDMRFFKHDGGLGASVGVGYLPIALWDMLMVPTSVNYLLGKNGHYFEVGAGCTFTSFGYNKLTFGKKAFRHDEHEVFATACLGYRRQPAAGGFLLRAGFTPLYGLSGQDSFSVYAGVSFGYAL
jgi:hypothetical protein